MSVEWTWYNDQHTIIVFTFHDPWTLEEFYMADSESMEAMSSLHWTVDAIMDLSRASHAPRNLVSGGLNRFKRAASVPNIGSAVVVHASPVLRTFIRVIQKLLPKGKLRLADNFAEAETILASIRNKRPQREM